MAIIKQYLPNCNPQLPWPWFFFDRIINLPHLFILFIFESHFYGNACIPKYIVRISFRRRDHGASNDVARETEESRKKTAVALYLTDLLIAYKTLLTDFGYWFQCRADAGRLIEVDIKPKQGPTAKVSQNTMHKHIITNFHINKYFNLSRVLKQWHQPKDTKHIKHKTEMCYNRSKLWPSQRHRGRGKRRKWEKKN